MKEKNGQIIIEENDCVQIVKGPNAATIGIVVSIQGNELKIWGRTPSIPGKAGEPYSCMIGSADVMYVGKGRLRPMKQGEQQKKIEKAPAPIAQSSALAPPKPPPQEPAPRSAPFLQSTQEKQLERVKAFVPDPTPSHPRIGGDVPDSDSIDLRPRPTRGDDIDPKLLEPVVFPGVSARDLHGKPLNPTALVQTEEQSQAQQPQQQPVENEQQRQNTQVPKAESKVPRRRGRPKKVRPSLGIPLEDQNKILER